jgi:hypothetical protein
LDARGHGESDAWCGRVYAGTADPLYAKVREGVRRLPHATTFAMEGLDHAAAFREAALALPHVTKFLQTVA